MEIHLVADTNLFFECKSLEQLPWAELGYDPVVVLLTKPVLDEIDKHKKESGRTRSRALDIFGRVRDMLAASSVETEIRAASPKVVLRRAPNIKPDPTFKDDLDYTKTDEKLVGIVSTLSASASDYRVKLFTDDTGPASTADGLGVPYLMIHESWRRPASETTEEKTIKELKKDLATYRAQEPEISIGVPEGANESNIMEVRRKIAVPLTDTEIEDVLAALRLKHPLMADFTPPAPSTTTNSAGETTAVEYTAPSESDISNYRDVLYPQWMDRCRGILKRLHEGRDELRPLLVLRWPMSNKGTRPATHLRIEFEATGPLMLRRIQTKSRGADDDGNNDEDSESSAPSTAQFPAAPRPPSFKRKVTPAPSPITLRVSKGLDVSTLSTVDLAKYQSQLLGRTGIDAYLKHAALAEHARPRAESIVIPAPYIPKPPNPESFYYDWPAGRLVKKGALTCDFWRHQTGDEVFEFQVLFANDDATGGTVECTVHAENLTKPEQSKVIVRRTIQLSSMIDVANAMVGDSE
ncbi:MAG TPA: PIN domain-containing protein [Paraburkholderia sp.]|uniref:PIN domain-containing protein n=1 Tax=Paraburkholderia sp. TaxID=1926495 RepID=UPI002ED5F309